ncbi:hypothetical protein [Paraburkholderia rhizosphaerae]|uniref:Uncharacterized protein n=1 Tax=Paraburkholderia rhizosphaerae TaxID=480658 RepID=A0A4R8LQX8_9BURK|nr:hypothetical protein [Paraburkholderia rhizosphaerae]TDY48300.1 hypothetical protein BX592_111235 [Paraburkholderia rhizosphaerae]
MTERRIQPEPDSLVTRRVSFQTAPGSFGEGTVLLHDLSSDIVVVVDDLDGSHWKGPAELAEPLDA